MKIKPTREQLQESYARLKSARKVGAEFNYTGESIRIMMHEYGLEMKTPVKGMYTCNHEFFSHDNEASFYVAGLMAADGCVKKHSGKDKTINQFYLCLGESDEQLISKVKELLKSNHSLHKVVKKNSERNSKWKDSHQLEWVITSERLCNDLKKFNVVPRKTHAYTFPEWLINHPLVNHFMRGYFDGDGSVYIPGHYAKKGVPQVYFNLRGTPPFLYIYRKILEGECQLDQRIKDIRVNNGIGILEYGGNGIVSKIAKFLYKDATVYLDRKYQIVKDLVK